ncbi:MAG: LytR C-terminal domain-containing protein [Acidobacteriota bacterium]
MNAPDASGRPHKRSAVLNAVIIALVALIGYESWSLYAARAQKPVLPPAHVRDSLRVNGGIQIDVLNGCGASGVGQTMTDFARSLGYDVVEMKNYKNFNQDASLVIDRSGKPETARELALHLGIDPKNVLEEVSRDYFVTASVVIGKDYRRLRPWNPQTKE